MARPVQAGTGPAEAVAAPAQPGTEPAEAGAAHTTEIGVGMVDANLRRSYLGCIAADLGEQIISFSIDVLRDLRSTAIFQFRAIHIIPNKNKYKHAQREEQ